MNHIKPFKLFEGDPWDNDPNAPWNQKDEPEPEREIDWIDRKGSEKLIKYTMEIFEVGDCAIVKKISNSKLYVVNTEGLEFEEDFEAYRLKHGYDDDENDFVPLKKDSDSIIAWLSDHEHDKAGSIGSKGSVKSWDDGEILTELDDKLREHIMGECDKAAKKWPDLEKGYIDTGMYLIGLSGFARGIFGI